MEAGSFTATTLRPLPPPVVVSAGFWGANIAAFVVAMLLLPAIPITMVVAVEMASTAAILPLLLHMAAEMGCFAVAVTALRRAARLNEQGKGLAVSAIVLTCAGFALMTLFGVFWYLDEVVRVI
ncbi:MAG: hypothetical protein HYT80_09090 [Euryarchaeota archaeon]|nr:hypothetical protein [Euryarchaeota archaeon]